MRRGQTEATLKGSGKVPSDRDRLMMLVMGIRRESRQALSRNVGMTSRWQVALEEARIACLTSSLLAGVKEVRRGGGKTGAR